MKENDWCFAWFVEESDSTGANRQALAKGSKWTSNDPITVSFLDGDESLKQKVKQYAREWTGMGMANLTLAFDDATHDTMVRVSFRFGGNWSLIGRDCLRRTNLELPTMNLEITSGTSEDMIRRRVLHEFGHVLGMIHEHQNPEAGIEWQRDRVIADLFPNWSVEDIERNVLTPAAAGETNSIAFDPESIMIYPIPAHWTKNGFSVDWNMQLSQKDKNFVKAQYP